MMQAINRTQWHSVALGFIAICTGFILITAVWNCLTGHYRTAAFQAALGAANLVVLIGLSRWRR